MKPSLALLLALLAVAAAGCERDNDASIEVFTICAPPEDAASCGTDGTCERVLASPRPAVFVTVTPLNGTGAVTNQLEMFVQVNNQLLPNDDPALGRVNTNDFIGGEYLLSFRGLPGLSDVVYPANFTVPADASQTPVIPLIPASTMLQIRPALNGTAGAPVIVELRIRGELRDGTEIETGPFEVAVDVINANFDANDPSVCTGADELPVGFCPNAGQTASVACEAPPAPAAPAP